MSMFVLKFVPEDVWTCFKARADAERWPLKALVLRLMEDYAHGRLTPSGEPPPRPPHSRVPESHT